MNHCRLNYKICWKRRVNDGRPTAHEGPGHANRLQAAYLLVFKQKFIVRGDIWSALLVLSRYKLSRPDLQSQISSYSRFLKMLGWQRSHTLSENCIPKRAAHRVLEVQSSISQTAWHGPAPKINDLEIKPDRNTTKLFARFCDQKEVVDTNRWSCPSLLNCLQIEFLISYLVKWKRIVEKPKLSL